MTFVNVLNFIMLAVVSLYQTIKFVCIEVLFKMFVTFLGNENSCS